jgi:hypothetical protein
MRFVTHLVPVLLLAPSAIAQTTTIFPSDFASREGDSYQPYGPLSSGIARTQTVYDRRDLPIAAGRRITHVGFRQDSNTASTGKSIQLAIYMGGTTFDATTMTGTFDNNYNGTARTLVFGPAVVALPNFTAQTTQQTFDLQLTAPYTVRANENLVVEFVVTANNNANQSFAWYIDEGSFYSATTSFGTGCQTSAGQVPQLTVSPYSYLGTYLSYSLTRAPASSLVWINLDFLNNSPIDCAPFGAPGCTLLVQPRIAVSATGSTGGSASFNFLLPADPALFHAVVYAQSAIFDLFANSLGFAFSNGTEITIGMYPLATRVVASGNASAATGSVQRNSTPITRFRSN